MGMVMGMRGIRPDLEGWQLDLASVRSSDVPRVMEPLRGKPVRSGVGGRGKCSGLQREAVLAGASHRLPLAQNAS